MKKVIVRESTKNKTDAVLKAKGVDVSVLWDTAYSTHVGGKTRIKIRCNVCGDIEDYLLCSLTSGRYKCDPCLINKYTTNCEKLGLKLVEKLYYKSQLKLRVECKICGTHSLVGTGHVSEGRFSCDGCMINKYKYHLKKKGCTFIKLSENFKKDHRIYYSNKYGDKFDAGVSNVLAGKFDISTDGNWNQPHSVYLIKLNTSHNSYIYKIGTANDPVRRARVLKLNRPHTVFTLGQFDTRREADKLESELHLEFSRYRLDKNLVSDYTDYYSHRKYSDGEYRYVKEGITEWFSSEVFDTIRLRYNLE